MENSEPSRERVTTVNCQCGEKLAEIPAEERVVAGSSTSNRAESRKLECKCGRKTNLRVRPAPVR